MPIIPRTHPGSGPGESGAHGCQRIAADLSQPARCPGHPDQPTIPLIGACVSSDQGIFSSSHHPMDIRRHLDRRLRSLWIFGNSATRLKLAGVARQSLQVPHRVSRIKPGPVQPPALCLVDVLQLIQNLDVLPALLTQLCRIPKQRVIHRPLNDSLRQLERLELQRSRRHQRPDGLRRRLRCHRQRCITQAVQVHQQLLSHTTPHHTRQPKQPGPVSRPGVRFDTHPNEVGHQPSVDLLVSRHRQRRI